MYILEIIYDHCFEYGTRDALDWYGSHFQRSIKAYSILIQNGYQSKEHTIEQMRIAYDRSISERKTLTFRQFYINDGTIVRNAYGLGSPANKAQA